MVPFSQSSIMIHEKSLQWLSKPQVDLIKPAKLSAEIAGPQDRSETSLISDVYERRSNLKLPPFRVDEIIVRQIEFNQNLY